MTPREQRNEEIKAEIDAFAERMKQVVDDSESLLKRFEKLTGTLAEDMDRRVEPDDQT